MAKTAPSPVDVLDFQFKLQSRLKIFENDSHETFKKPCGLVTAASRYGLIFVGTSSPKFQVIEVQDIQNFTVKDGDVTGYRRRTVPLPSIPKYLGANCDSTRLCVVVEKDGCIKALIYDVSSFLKQNVSILQQIRLSTTPGVNIIDLCWNPSVPSMLVACKDDGTLGLYDVKDNGIEIKELPKTIAATSICWSPKGKQIVVGSADGKLTQYKLDLQVAKVISPPPINGNPYPISLQWISNYQFIAVYKTNGNDSQMSLMVVDAPKNAEPSYTNYDDVCYSYGNARPYQFYMLQQPLWNILLVASSNSMEVGIMHLEKDSWTQWILTDSARAELPLNAIKQDTLPVGMAFDVSSNKPVPWGENELPPAPYLFLLSHQGVMCCFHTLNLKEGAPKLCTPPEVLPDRSGVVHFTMGEHPVQAAPVMNLIKPTPVAQTTLPAFGMNITTQQSTIFGSPALITSQKIPPTPTFFNKPATSTPSLFGTQTQPFATLKTEAQSTMLTKPQVEIKKVENSLEIESGQKAIITKPSVISQQVKQMVVPELKPTPTQKSAVSGIPAINEETEKLLAQMIKEECANLDLEIKVLLSQGSSIKVDLGNDLEATSIVEGATALQDFLKEMNEISTTQAAEIHVLKQTLIQTWVWYEEARSRFATYKDPTLKSILLAQPLDAASERKLDEIRHLIYYLESQLVQANTALDEQWETFQDSCKKKLSTRIPNIEAIYQVMVKQNATLQRQVYVLKDISMRIRSKLKNINTPRLLVSLDNTGELEEQLRSLHMEPKDLVQIRYEKVLKRQKRLSKERVDKLKEYFQNGNVSHVTVRKPLNNSFMQMSGLGVMPFSPIVPKKTLREERLDFVQSTPLPESIKTSNVIVESNPPAPVVVNLFKQESKAVGSDVKTSAFVPMVNTKNSFFGTGLLDQNSLYNQKTQKAAVENVSKPPTFNLGPPNTAVVTQKSSSSNFFGTIPVFNTTSKPSELNNKVPISVPPSVSISLIKSSANETQAAKPNAFTQFSMPSSQNFNFLMNKPGSNVTSGLPTEKASTLSEPEGSKSLFSSIFGHAAKNVDVTKIPSTNFGEKNIFGQDSTAAISENKSFAIGKPAAFFGQVPQSSADLFKITSTPKTTATNQIVTTAATSVPGLFTQVFTSNVQSEPFPKIFGQIPSTTNSVFAPQSPIATTSSSFSLGQGIISSTPATTTSTINSTNSINNQQISITTAQMVSPIGTTIPTIKPSANDEITTDNNLSQTITTVLPAFGQLTTTGAVFGNTTTTSIFVQPVSTTKVAGISQQLTSITTTGTTPLTSNSTTQQCTTASSTSTSSTIETTTSASPFAQITSSASLFGQKPTSGMKMTTATPILGQPTTQTPSIFAKVVPTFGQSTTTAILGQTPSVFSSPTTTATASVATTPFMPSTATAFVQSTTTTPFVQSTTPFTQSTTSFVQSTPTTFLQSSGTTPFVQSATTTPFVQSTTTTPFVQNTTMPFAQTTSTPAVFGQAVTSTSPSNLFIPATTSSNLFKQQATTSSSIFGQATSTQSVFGQTTSTPPVFGQKTPTPSVPIFGQPTLTQSSTPIFGQTTASPTVFGQTTTSPSVFGQATSTPAAFGQTTSAPSIFGQTAFTQTSTPSIFGQPTSTPSIFGQPTSTPNIFGQQTSTPSVFGQTTSAPSVFGQPSTPIFGQTTSSTPIFGQQQQSVFPQPTTSVFGQPVSSASIFGQPTTSTPSVFAQNSFGNNSIFKTSTNVFGGTSPFAQTPTTTSVFGSSPPFGTSSVFGGNTTNNVFSKPSFGTTDNLNFGGLNTGGGPTTTASATVFGSSFNSFRTADKDQPFNTTNNVFESPSTTSTSSVFGNSPFSKSTPAFGGPATFGSTPTFSQPSGFGSTFVSNANFGSANQPGPFSGGATTQTVSQTGFGSSAAFQKPAFINQSGFGSQPGGFGAPPTFGASTFGGSPSFGSPNRVFGNAETFGAPAQQQNSTFANLANQQTIGFGSVAQQAPVENMQQPSFTGGSSFTSWR